MGLGDVFKTIGKGLLKSVPIVGPILSEFGGGASNEAAGRRGDAVTEGNMAGINNRSNLDAAEFNMGTGQQRLSQIGHSDQLAGMQDFEWVRDAAGNITGSTGGLRPSNFGPNTREGAQALSKEALQALLSGSDQVTPQQATLPDPGFREQAGGVAGLVGGIAGAVDDARQPSLLEQMQKRQEELDRLSGPQIQQRHGQPDTSGAYGNVRF